MVCSNQRCLTFFVARDIITEGGRAMAEEYQLTAHPNTIIRTSDQAFIPTDPDNTDYQDYLAWLDEGNEPNPVPGDPMPPIDARLGPTSSRSTLRCRTSTRG